MIPRKLLEAAFRQFWVLALPILLAPIVVFELVDTAPTYRSQATVWVSQPDNIDPGVFSRAASPWETPAQVQAQVLRDLLATKSFREAVAAEAGIRGEDAAQVVSREVFIATSGTSLVTIGGLSKSADHPQPLVTAVVDQFKEKSAAESDRAANVSVEYFTKQLELASKELDVRRSELAAYLQANPRAAEPTRVDANYLRLQGKVDSQAKLVDGLVSSLQESQRKLASAPQSLEAKFNLQDPATRPEEVSTSLTKRAGYPAAALLFGLAISASYLFLLFRTDHAIRSTQDLAGLPVPLLGYVPELPRRYQNLLEAVTPLRWIPWARHRDYARAVAASISIIPVQEGTA